MPPTRLDLRGLIAALALIALAIALFAWAGLVYGQPAPAPPTPSPSLGAQSQVEQTLGALIVRNAQCAVQVSQLSEELRQVQGQLRACKAATTHTPTPPTPTKPKP